MAEQETKPPSSPGVRFATPSAVERIRSTMTPGRYADVSQVNQSNLSIAFTLTPNNRSGSMMLLSPSRTITESLTTLASSTGQQLEEVWDEVGYSPDDRASQLSDLLMKFRDICEQKIAEERGVAETFRQTIAEATEEITSTAAALKMDATFLLEPPQEGQTLADALTAVEATLENLRATASKARSELEDCRKFLIESHQALGLDMDPTWNDINSDLTAPRGQAFQNKRAEMKEELSTRTAAVVQLVKDCQHLMRDLRMEAESGSELDRRIAGSLVRSKDDSFMMASKFRSETCVGINAEAVEELTKRAAELHREKRRRQVRLQEMGGEIALLWNQLHISYEEQEAFTDRVQGLGTDTMAKGEAELKRLHQMKSQMIGKLIEESRETIMDLWDQINATEENRQGFAPFHVKSEELFNDELLDQHEKYIGVLQLRLEQMKPILRLIERRQVIVNERMEYEDLQKDSDRLKQRGAALTRQLMEEEKMARRIKRELPRLTEHLNEKLHEWKKEHGEEFEVGGEAYLEIMDRQEIEWNQYKEQKHQLMLIKKQEEKTLGDNRYVGGPTHPGAKKRQATRAPLGEAPGADNNYRNPSQGRSHGVAQAPMKQNGLINQSSSRRL